MPNLILAIDQGTTSSRAIAFEVCDDHTLKAVAISQIELAQHFPHSGWVEHDAAEIWTATLQTCREVIRKAGGIARFAAIGITNQRETAVIWDAATGEPLHWAIVWQDRRTADVSARMVAQGHEPAVQAATGLILDPYFSATKYAWLLDKTESRDRAAKGEVKLGTIDSWLVWKLTAQSGGGGAHHVTDATNASRTSLMDLRTRAWREDLCALFDVPMAALPRIVGCAEISGESDPALFGRPLPIAGSAGDQQAALVGHGALMPGDAKITYGTGAFLVANVGAEPVASKSRLLGTLGYQVGEDAAYALEGSIFSAGSAIQWLRDGVGMISESRQSEGVAQGLKDNGGVYLVPGFTGLGAPWWRPDARGAVVGLTRDTGPAHFVRAALEALAYQTHDLLEALAADGAPPLKVLKVDGGVTANAFAMQFVADICQVTVERPAFQEMTALGAAKLAALGIGLIDDLTAHASEAPAVWTPRMGEAERDRLLKGWRGAVRAAIIASE